MAGLENATLAPIVARCQRACEALDIATETLAAAQVVDQSPSAELQERVDAAAAEVELAWKDLICEVDFPIARKLSNCVNSREAVEDLFQDFLKILWDKIYEIRCTDNPASLMFRIAENLRIDFLRKGRTFRKTFDPDAEFDLVIEIIAAPEAPHLARPHTKTIELRKAYYALSKEEREVLLRRHVVGQSREEIAEATDLTDRQVKRRIEVAMARIRKSMPSE